MKKIFVDKEESIAQLVERVISDTDTELNLVIPKNSVLKESIANFNILKREAAAAGKSVLIETVDAETLALAQKAKLEAFHPLFQDGAKSKSLSDIRPQAASAGAEDTSSPSRRSVDIRIGTGGKAKVKSGAVLQPDPAPYPEPQAEPEPQQEPEPLVARQEPVRRISPEALSSQIQSEPESASRSRFRMPLQSMRVPRLGKRGIVVLLIIVLLGAGGVWVTNQYFGRADISITFKTTPFENTLTVLASKTVAQAAASGTVLPAEFLSQTKNTTQFFPASERANVSLKATARLTIYNAYSSQAQSLVATTRFETPDGKIFRLDKGITIPGAVVTSGKITPSSIDADVTADQPGDAYNIGPVPKLTIPGFKGSPKFEGFFGELKEQAQGGATGERAVPTEADIAAAKERVTEILRSGVQSNSLNNRPEDFVIVNGSSEFTVTRLTVNQATNEEGKFSVLGEAQFRAVAFRETDLRAALTGMASGGRTDLEFRELTLDYQNPKVDFQKGEISFTVQAKGALAPKIDAGNLKQQLAGQGVGEARSTLLALPDLLEAKISLLPIWLQAVPSDADRITLDIH